MRIKHLASFVLTIVIVVLFAALSVVWSMAHMVAVAFTIALVPVLRWVSHRESRRSF